MSLIGSSFDSNCKKFEQQARAGYQKAQQALTRMQELDIIVSPPPIKKQTLSEKIKIVQNFDQCVDTYNVWAATNGEIADIITDELMHQQTDLENKFWRQPLGLSHPVSVAPPTQLLRYQNDDGL